MSRRRRSFAFVLALAAPTAGAGCSALLGIEDLPGLPHADGGRDGAAQGDAAPMGDVATAPDHDAPVDAADAGDAPTTNTGACQPFKLVPCSAGYRCDVQLPNGSAKCESLHGIGVGEGQQCAIRTDCSDGMDCFAPFGADGSVTFGNCLMLCLTPGASPLPFDAAALAHGPLTGGCNVGKTCSVGVDPQVYPPWISVCQ